MSGIKLREGWTYRDILGQVWVVQKRDSDLYPFTDVDRMRTWTENGVYDVGMDTVYNLIEEVTEQPPEPTRKDYPVTTGCLHYFPDALMAVARCSLIGNDQHNPGEPLHWAVDKSNDHLDCLGRHLLDAGEMDDDGILHDVKVAWRALANLQTVINEGKDVFE